MLPKTPGITVWIKHPSTRSLAIITSVASVEIDYKIKEKKIAKFNKTSVWDRQNSLHTWNSLAKISLKQCHF